MKITAQDLLRFGIIDQIIEEPSAAPTASPEAAIKATGDAIDGAFAELDNLPPEEVRRQRREKYPCDRPLALTSYRPKRRLALPGIARRNWDVGNGRRGNVSSRLAI